MAGSRRFGRWELLNVVGTGVLFAAVPAGSVAVYRLAQRSSCGGRLRHGCDAATGSLVFTAVVAGFLVIGLGIWTVVAYHVFSGRRIPAGRFVPTYVSLCGTALCTGIAVTRDSPAPRLVFGAVALVVLAVEVTRILRLPDRKRGAALLRAASVPLHGGGQENERPWEGPLSGFEIAHYAAMGVGAVAGLLSAVSL
ncbi:hypothetical protein [Streptomyces glaucosporus]|uniref:hypothetical protein n=1 Tax=Streptomyces glaucosporus TaxID=284044 RepID=UPI0031D87601